MIDGAPDTSDDDDEGDEAAAAAAISGSADVLEAMLCVSMCV